MPDLTFTAPHSYSTANSVNRSVQYATLLRPTICERWHGCTDLPDGQISDLAVQPPLQKYSASPVGQIISIASPVSPDERGGSRSSRTRGGMRGTRRWRLKGGPGAGGARGGSR